MAVVGVSVCEAKTRRPVDATHPCVAAAIAVLRAVGGPLPISVIFEHAHDMGLLPASAHNTIRGRLSQHVIGMARPSLIHLPSREGWALSDAATVSTTSGQRLRDFTLTPPLMLAHGAPTSFAHLVQMTPGSSMTVRSALMRPIDGPGLDWLLAGAGGLLRFPEDVVDRLRRARGVGGRARVIHGLERRDPQQAVA